RRDAIGGRGDAEVRIDLANRPRAVGVAKMMRVPLDALRVVGGEEVGLLDSGGQVDAALQNFVQPRGAGAAGTDADEVGQSQVARVVGRLSHLFKQRLRGALAVFSTRRDLSLAVPRAPRLPAGSARASAVPARA